MNKLILLFVFMVSSFTMSNMFAQENENKLPTFVISPSEVKPLQETVTEHVPLGKWDNKRDKVSGTRSSECFPGFDRPLLPSEGDVWDKDVICITKDLPDNSELLWVDANDFVIQEGGDNLIFSADAITQIYVGLRKVNASGQIDCQELFPARRFYLASNSDGSYGIDYNSVTHQISVDFEALIDKEFEVILNNLMLVDSLFGSDANKIWLQDGLTNGLQQGTYRTQTAFQGHAAQTHYLVYCDAEFDATVDFSVKNSCLGKNNGEINFTSVSGGSGHYKLIVFNSDGESIERGLFNDDQLKLDFDGLEPGDYTFQVKDIFGVAYDVFDFVITEEESEPACDCLVTNVTDTVEIITETINIVELDYCSDFGKFLDNWDERASELVDSLSNDLSTAVLDQLGMEFKVTFGPNPTSGQISAYMDADTEQRLVEIVVTNSLGQEVLRTTEMDFDLTDLQNGIYNVTALFQMGNGQTAAITAEKVIKLE